MLFFVASSTVANTDFLDVRTRDGAKGVGAALRTVDDMFANPQLLKGQSLDQVKSLLGTSKGWKNDVMRKSTTNPNGG